MDADLEFLARGIVGVGPPPDAKHFVVDASLQKIWITDIIIRVARVEMHRRGAAQRVACGDGVGRLSIPARVAAVKVFKRILRDDITSLRRQHTTMSNRGIGGILLRTVFRRKCRQIVELKVT